MFSALKVIWSTARKINKDHKQALVLANDSYESLVNQLVDSIDAEPAEEYSANLRPPSAELNTLPLPPELKEFYLVSDGIYMSFDNPDMSIKPASDVISGKEFNPAFSTTLKQWFEEEENEEDEMAVIRDAGASTIGKLMADAYDYLLPLNFFDEQLILQFDSEGEALVFVNTPSGEAVYGEVLHIELDGATSYSSLKHYLAATITLHSGLKDILKAS